MEGNVPSFKDATLKPPRQKQRTTLSDKLCTLASNNKPDDMIAIIKSCIDLNDLRETITDYSNGPFRLPNALLDCAFIHSNTKHGRGIRQALRDQYNKLFPNGIASEDNTSVIYFLCTPEDDLEDVKEYDIAGLKFRIECFTRHFNIIGLLPGDSKRYSLVTCSGCHVLMEESGLVKLDDFFNSANNSGTKYYKAAKMIVQKDNRTLAGVIMELIRTFLMEFEHNQRITVGVDVWHTSDITTTDVKETATKLFNLGEKKDCWDPTKLVDRDNEVDMYVSKRYKRLYPDHKTTFKDYLNGLKIYGWYSPWIQPFSVDASNMGVTAASLV